MKKIYNKPETTTVLLFGTNAIMAGSPPSGLIDLFGGGGSGAPGSPD